MGNSRASCLLKGILLAAISCCTDIFYCGVRSTWTSLLLHRTSYNTLKKNSFWRSRKGRCAKYWSGWGPSPGCRLLRKEYTTSGLHRNRVTYLPREGILVCHTNLTLMDTVHCAKLRIVPRTCMLTSRYGSNMATPVTANDRWTSGYGLSIPGGKKSPISIGYDGVLGPGK